jgi:phosphoribosyl-ATP pyrophosphohydrolase/phosphoribosyl-AMP cyclohydrolase
MSASLDLESLAFDKGGGLVTVVAQHAETGVVLMVAHADREALEKTIATGEMHYRSRTRGLWHKGATSGNTQRVVSLSADCDGDAVLARVIPAGPACHVGTTSCFGDTSLDADTFGALDRVIASRLQDGDSSTSYTKRLLGDRNLRLKKLGEETAELVTALADGNTGAAVNEASDLIYHTLVALRSVGATVDEVRAVLAQRAR